MLKEETESLKGDDQLEGFAVDIIIELSQLLEFNYTFIVEEDAEYGKELPDGSWVSEYTRITISRELCGYLNVSLIEFCVKDGMIGKLMREEADIAITDLTVTLERIKAIDFSPSILDLGENIYIFPFALLF